MNRLNDFRQSCLTALLFIAFVASTAMMPFHVRHRDEPLAYLNYVC